MSSKSVETYGAQGRKEALLFDPDDLVIVEDPENALCDDASRSTVDESLVLSIMYHGVLETILVRLNGQRKNGKPIVEVVDGRQRIRAAREANKRLRKQGSQPIQVPAMARRGEDADMLGLMITANELRKDNAPMVKAKLLQKYLDYGRSEEQAAIQFGVHPSTIKNMLALLDLAPEVQADVASGALGATVAAKKIAKLPREEQVPAVEAMKANGATKGKKAIAAANAAIRGDKAPVPDLPSRPSLKHLWHTLVEARQADDADEVAPALALLKWMFEGKRPGGALGKYLTQSEEEEG